MSGASWKQRLDDLNHWWQEQRRQTIRLWAGDAAKAYAKRDARFARRAARPDASNYAKARHAELSGGQS